MRKADATATYVNMRDLRMPGGSLAFILKVSSGFI